jgi:type III restriction enzyme
VAKSIIAYDRDLPEVPGRRAWERPTSFLVRDAASEIGWRVDESGRRPSGLLLVSKLRQAVDKWREAQPQYQGASDVTRELFRFWFEEDHEVAGFGVPFRYYFCQREAIETLAYLVEICGKQDCKELIEAYADIHALDLFQSNIEFQTGMDGSRQIKRYVAELYRMGVQDLPPENLRRYAFKMATGSGKTLVMAMVMVWAYYHKKWVGGSPLARNFLIVAPNVIVYQRLEKDLASNRIFHELPLVPREWGEWNLKVIRRGENAEPDPSGNVFLTNVQQLYESREQEWTPENAVDALLGCKPVKDLASYQRSMLERVKSLPELVVINDEAHHVHEEGLAWTQSLLGLHRVLPRGLALWLDFSATPKDQNGMYFPWTVCDYPLAQAVEDRIVKAPIIVTKEDDARQPAQDPEHVTKGNVCEKYGYWIQAAMQRWREHQETYKKVGIRPVLFLMAEKNVYADAIAEYLWKTSEFGLRESEVLVIHTDEAGEITKKDLEKARQAARDIDKPESNIKAIVSVMMLREGWDVRNVSVVLGLRPFTAKAEILPEQVIGRGLRLMTGTGSERTQTLEVLGTRNLLNVLRQQLEAEGVGVGITSDPPPPPIWIEPVRERLTYDIAIPLTKPSLTHNMRRLSDIDPASLEAIYESGELDETFRSSLRLVFVTTLTEISKTDLTTGALPLAQELLGSIVNKVMQQAKLPSAFAQVYPLVRGYVAGRCFGSPVDVDAHAVRFHLRRLELQEGIAKYLARKIGELTVERRPIEFDKADFRLSNTRPFQWRRNLQPEPLQAKKTIFNYVASYNPFERRFAQFLDQAADVLRFASLGTTEQGESGTQFRVDYLKPSGAIGFYHPDWAVVQATPKGEVNWIIETKGRVWEGTEAKDAAISEWCQHISQQTGGQWWFARVNQVGFEAQIPVRLSEIVKGEARPAGGQARYSWGSG